VVTGTTLKNKVFVILSMSKGHGRKIKNWEKAGTRSDFWKYQGEKNVMMKIGEKNRQGYPIIVFGEDTRTEKIYRGTKEKARNKAADWRRNHTNL
jgi:acyl-[acyl carrier protein]--UDP-N-acetylglucosamine O-acyltransferase